MRVGLNSGRVIAGDIGSGTLGYAATGETVGMANRIETATPPGEVMVSESTARLVETSGLLSEREWVHIKGAAEPVCVRRLLGIRGRDGLAQRAEASLVGRRWEMAALEALVDRTYAGRGGVVTVVGPPGIGKSRTARETAAAAAGRGVDVYWAFCESHASDVPFHVVAQLLRAATGVNDLSDADARLRLRTRFPDTNPQDLLLLDDLLGIADTEVPLPAIDPDARRRRLTALVNTTSLARTEPALFIVEDAQWIDAVSESMLADFIAVVPRTPSMVLITARPEYQGALMRVPGAQSIALAPLGDSDTAALIDELLGSDPSVGGLATVIVDRAAGNPFFAEEMVRELAQRGVLTGERGGYICRTDVADVSVPATVQATIAARIDRLDSAAKRTLTAASVIGLRFGADLLTALGIDPGLDELVGLELIDQVRFTPIAEYAFHHPLIRAVAYDSQLKSDRAQWHRRLAAAIESGRSESDDQDAALIAEHLQAAGDLPSAYGWHMRAAAWSTNRDVAGARMSWEQARIIADAMPGDDPNQLSMRIAPRTMLCATDYQDPKIQDTRSRFAELQELCASAGDKVSLVIAMTGLVTELFYTGFSREASQLASEQIALLESIGDPPLTMGLAFVHLVIWFDAGEFGKVLRWAQNIVDLAAGDPARGAGFGFGSPLAIALAYRCTARWWLGLPGWRQDLHDAVALARNSDPVTFAAVVCWTYGSVMPYGVLRADDSVLRVSEEALQAAEAAGNAVILGLAKYTLGVALMSQGNAADRGRGLDLIVEFREFVRGFALFLVPVADVWIARERAGRGDRDAAIAVMRHAVDELHQAGRLFYGVWGTGVLVETLVARGTAEDVAEAEQVIDRLADLRSDEGSAVVDVTVLRSRALVAGARGEDAAYRELVGRYRTTAASHGFEGHIGLTEAM